MGCRIWWIVDDVGGRFLGVHDYIGIVPGIENARLVSTVAALHSPMKVAYRMRDSIFHL